MECIMYAVSEQIRKYHVNVICELVSKLLTIGWLPTSHIAVCGVGACNVRKVTEETFKADAKYRFGDRTYTGDQIVAMIPDYDGEYPIVVEGRHRAVAAVIAKALGWKGNVNTIEVTPDVASRVAIAGNGANDLVARMASAEKLDAIIPLVKEGLYKRESDLPFLRGTSQKLWAQAQLVLVHGIPAEKAGLLDKETARKAAMSTNVQEYVEAALAEGKAPVKAMSRTKIEEICKLADGLDPKSVISQLMHAILDDAEITAKSVVVKALRIEERPKQEKKSK